MGRLGPTELLIILVIVFLIFGAYRLPQLGSGLGQAIKGFRDSVAGETQPKRKRAVRTPKKKVEEEKKV
jgi:sec-independent protein translocase protein TatA